MARGRRTRCDKPSSPFVDYIPDGVGTSTTTSTTQTPFIFIPESGVTCPVSTTESQTVLVPSVSLPILGGIGGFSTNTSTVEA